ncbi:hypothetical protein [Clostridium tagluense]|uniref:Uncharacterized protein n=1 Tax=Clostridium tagluense TaxID=360422 RepID=A0A401UTL5_9CLOT|nr:hypothetical protein [Clostridium tagluense]GCD12899.1 hypothetical protein Ctaglu_45220 [Clostridium tagluense]
MKIIILMEFEKITSEYCAKEKLRSMIGNGWYFVGTKSIKVTRKSIDDKKYLFITSKGLTESEQEYLVRCKQ